MTPATTGPRHDPAAAWLAAASVSAEVFRLRPDYGAVLITADGLRGGPGDAASDRLLREAENKAAALLADGRAPADLPHVAQWREAYRSFGAKANRTRPSVEALLRRAGQGLPRIDRITDIYNAISVAHLIPVGGEDRDSYDGAARLVRADGTEKFEITRDGQPAVEHPEPGEMIWRDDDSVTCRIWNWRQCTRTRLTESTRNAIFILDGLSDLGQEGLLAAAGALTSALAAANPDASISQRLITMAG